MVEFTVHDLRDVLGKKQGTKLIDVLHTNRCNLSSKEKRIYVPFTTNKGIETTRLLHLSVFNLDEVIDLYEARLAKFNYRHLVKANKRILTQFYKVRKELTPNKDVL